MFHTLITLAYTIPGLYLFFRIWKLFIPPDHRLKYVLIFVFIFSIYPVSNFFHDRNAGILAQIITSMANYLLPFFLYVFLLVLLTDLLLLMNLVFKTVPGGKIKNKAIMVKVFYLIMFLAAAIVVGGIINFNTIRTSEYRINVPGRSSELSSLRIAFVSDFHLQDGTSTWFVEKFVKKIKVIGPDIILFGGDIIEGDNQGEKMIRFEELISTVKTGLGTYGVPGNHEHYSRRDRTDFFRKSGITMLSDSVIVMDHKFSLAGRNDASIASRKSAADIASMAPDSLPLIMMDHRPTEINQISRTKTDIALSGHTHHGQLFPVNLITRKVYRLSYGYLKEGNTHFFVSSGIRLWGFPVRTTAKSEIIVIDVEFSTSGK